VTDKAEETTGPEPKEATGLFADKLNDEWEKMEYQSLKFRFYGGRSLKAKQRYPVVVYLHGRGSGGTDNEKNLQGAALKFAERDFYKDHPSFVIVPQCPDDNTGWRGAYLDDIIGLIEEALENLPVDKDRIYITGVSMGGYGTWSALAHSPKLFAAAVPVCGGGSPATAKSIKGKSTNGYSSSAGERKWSTRRRTRADGPARVRCANARGGAGAGSS